MEQNKNIQVRLYLIILKNQTNNWKYSILCYNKKFVTIQVFNSAVSTGADFANYINPATV